MKGSADRNLWERTGQVVGLECSPGCVIPQRLCDECSNENYLLLHKTGGLFCACLEWNLGITVFKQLPR